MKKRGLSCLLVILLVFGAATYADATGIDDLKEEQKRQEKIADKRWERGKQFQSQIAEVNEKITQSALSIDEVHTSIVDLQEEIEENERSIEKIEIEKERIGIDLGFLIRFLYENRYRMDPLSVFLRSHSIADFINQTYYAKTVTENMNSRLKEYIDMDELVKSSTIELKRMKKVKADDEKKLLEQQEDLEKQLDSLSVLMEDAFGEALDAIDRSKEIKEQIKDLEEEERRAMEARTSQESNTWEPGEITESAGSGFYNVEPYPYTDAELKLMAGIIQAEAGSTSYPGMIAVGSVVMNRLADSRFPGTISGVIYAPHQFSPAGSGRLAVILAEGPVNACYNAARDVLNGKRNVHNLYFKASWYAREHGISGIEIGGNVFH